MICVETFQQKTVSDFENWDAWVKFVNNNFRYAKTKSTIFDFYGKCKAINLPSFHPYWENEAKKISYKMLMETRKRYAECIKDQSKIKYYFNITTSIQDIVDKIKSYEEKCEGIVL